MLGLPPLHKPGVVWRDLKALLGRRTREQAIALALSLAITGLIVFIFWLDPQVNTAPPPTIQYVDSWSAERSDAEIKAKQARDKAEAEARAAARQQEFKELANNLGIE